VLGERFERRFQNFPRALVPGSVDAALRDGRRQSLPFASHFSLDQTLMARSSRMTHRAGFDKESIL
jgi:hypothetical protein